jgi:hypothetical protein
MVWLVDKKVVYHFINLGFERVPKVHVSPFKELPAYGNDPRLVPKTI